MWKKIKSLLWWQWLYLLCCATGLLVANWLVQTVAPNEMNSLAAIVAVLFVIFSVPLPPIMGVIALPVGAWHWHQGLKLDRWIPICLIGWLFWLIQFGFLWLF